MSAAEKLRALIVGFWEDTAPSGHEAPVEIIRALPQIRAVVEAVEQREAVHVLNAGAESGMASLLRALDEKLASDR